jgi:hypothetical protein
VRKHFDKIVVCCWILILLPIFIWGLLVGFSPAQKTETPPIKYTPKDCCKNLGAANDARPIVNESCRAMRAGLRYIEEGLPQDREMRADAREKLATAIVHAEVWLEATK